MNKIIERLYLGNIAAANNLHALKSAGITHILCVASGVEPRFEGKFKYRTIKVSDTSSQSLIRHFPAAIAFIKEGIQKGGVLVHCFAGVSRSATCVIAFLMQEKNMTFEKAFAFASQRRPIIFPNMGFQKQLSEFEKLLHLHKSYSSPTRMNKQSKQIISGISSGSGAASHGHSSSQLRIMQGTHMPDRDQE